jgi:hypothetical protein
MMLVAVLPVGLVVPVLSSDVDARLLADEPVGVALRDVSPSLYTGAGDVVTDGAAGVSFFFDLPKHIF